MQHGHSSSIELPVKNEKCVKIFKFGYQLETLLKKDVMLEEVPLRKLV